MSDDDLFVFLDDDQPPAEASTAPRWKILIVDDEPDVHAVTHLALSDVSILGRKLSLIDAVSAAEARSRLAEERDFAVILLDVVMESESAGLELVRVIREELKLHEPRIILRTGQPGYAPEIAVIQAYDINDYRMKSELTRTRLITALTSAIRAYAQLQYLASMQEGLRTLVRDAPGLFAHHALEDFAGAVLEEVTRLLAHPASGLFCYRRSREALRGPDELEIVAATGEFLEATTAESEDWPSPAIRACLVHTLASQSHQFEDGFFALYLARTQYGRAVVYFRLSAPLSALERQLLELLSLDIDVTLENITLFNHLKFNAYHDELTGLLNRTGFLDMVEELLRADRNAWVIGIIDIDNFADLNDALGFQRGDALLSAFGRRLQALPELTTLARISGDSFAFIAPDNAVNPGRLLAYARAPVPCNGTALCIKLTLGLARVRDLDGDSQHAFKAAHIALKRAKTLERGGYVYYEPLHEAEIRERVERVHALSDAIRADELELFFQPQVLLGNPDRVVSAEALIRWRKPSGEWVLPSDFIPLAETTGFILELGEWILTAALRTLKRWHDEGLRLRLAVNVSPQQLLAEDFLPRVRELLQETALPPELLELEITESIMMQNLEKTLGRLRALRDLGLSIALDDFGTGYSSLAYLKQLPVDRLKIDRLFVQSLSGPAPDATLAELILSLGRKLKLAVLAEGVETEEQRERLLQMCCAEAQGYLFARPLPEALFRQWLVQRG